MKTAMRSIANRSEICDEESQIKRSTAYYRRDDHCGATFVVTNCGSRRTTVKNRIKEAVEPAESWKG